MSHIALQFTISCKCAISRLSDYLTRSLSQMMGDMLSYMESRSAAYVARVSRPDENYAREMMQLFTIGVQWSRKEP